MMSAVSSRLRIAFPFLRLCAIGAACACLQGSLHAQEVWGSATSGNWNLNTNWSPGTVPGSTTITTIAATGSAYTVTLSGSSGDIATLTLDSANATLAISGTYLYLQANAGVDAFTLGAVQLSGGAEIIGYSSLLGTSLTNAVAITSTSGSNYIYSNGGVANGMTFANAGSVTVTGGALYLGYGAADSVTNTGSLTANG